MRATRAMAGALLCALTCAGQDAHFAEGKRLFEAGRFSQALPEFRQANTPEAAVYTAVTEAAMGHCAAAAPALEEASRQTTPSAKLAGLASARCSSAAGDVGRAFATVERLATRWPKDADVLYLKAEVEMKAFNQTTFEMFQRVPGSYRVHQLSAEILEVENRYGEAAAEYRQAIAASPEAPDLHYRLGRAILLESHSPEALAQAEKEFAAELRISPEDSASEFQLGQIAQVQGNSEAARAHWQSALKLSPDFVNALVALGRLEVQRKQYPSAIALLEHATAVQADNEAAHYALLTAYRDAGKRDKALEEKATLDRLQKPPEGEFSDFLKKLGDKPPAP